MCRLDELTPLGGAVVGAGTAVGAPPEAVVGAGAVVATGVAVAEEPHATMNTKIMDISTAGFLRVENSINQPPVVGFPRIFQAAVWEGGTVPLDRCLRYMLVVGINVSD